MPCHTSSSMPYQYLTFSDLFEEQSRPSASSPVLTSSAIPSPTFLLPSTSYYHHKMSLSSTDAHYVSRRGFGKGALKVASKASSQDSSDMRSTPSSSSVSLHLDFLKVWKRRSSLKRSSDAPDSTLSTPTSSRRSSFTSQGLGLHLASAASSANTSPAISRQVTKVSDYDALVLRTASAEEDEERQRQSDLQAYFHQAATTGLSLRRM